MNLSKAENNYEDFAKEEVEMLKMLPNKMQPFNGDSIGLDFTLEIDFLEEDWDAKLIILELMLPVPLWANETNLKIWLDEHQNDEHPFTTYHCKKTYCMVKHHLKDLAEIKTVRCLFC